MLGLFHRQRLGETRRVFRVELSKLRVPPVVLWSE